MQDETWKNPGDENHLLDHIVFVGGAPRSGTTFAAKSLNLHPAFVAAIDDHVYECWGLYYYRKRSGLVQTMRSRPLAAEEAREILRTHLVVNDQLVGAATSDKTKGFPPAAKNLSFFPGSVPSQWENNLVRHSIPLAQFSKPWRLCLKSPEISFVLPQLASNFPGALFVLVYRPIEEIAESMYRKGNSVKRLPVYQKRWIDEKTMAGELIPPPGVPVQWENLWQTATDFQRCVIYAASYLRGILEGVAELAAGRYFIYNHLDLRNTPQRIFQSLAQFLHVEASGFQMAQTRLKTDKPLIDEHLKKEYIAVEDEMELNTIMRQLESITGSI